MKYRKSKFNLKKFGIHTPELKNWFNSLKDADHFPIRSDIINFNEVFDIIFARISYDVKL